MFTFKKIHDNKSSILNWNKFILKAPFYSYVQSFQWSRFKNNSGWDTYNYALYKKNKISGTIALMTPCKPLLKNKIYYSPGGPVLDFKDKAIAGVFFIHLLNLLKEKNASFLKFSYNIPDTNHDILSILQKYSLQLSNRETFSIGLAQAPSTLVINLMGKDQKSILKKFSRRTAEYITRSFRLGLKIKSVNTEKELELFYSLLKSTARKKNFLIHPFSYYQNFYSIFCKVKKAYSPHGRILLAFYNGKAVAGRAGIIFHERLWELFVASDTDYHHLRPNHRLVYELIKYAMENRCKYYDFNGVLMRSEDRGLSRDKDKSYKNLSEGLAFFKTRFNGEFVRFIPEHDMVLSEYYYKLWNLMIPGIKLIRKASEFLKNIT